MASWNAEYQELRDETAAAVGRARALLLTAQELAALVQSTSAANPEHVESSVERAVADAARLVRRNTAHSAAITVLESEASIERARATLRRAMEACAAAQLRRANQRATAAVSEWPTREATAD